MHAGLSALFGTRHLKRRLHSPCPAANHLGRAARKGLATAGTSRGSLSRSFVARASCEDANGDQEYFFLLFDAFNSSVSHAINALCRTSAASSRSSLTKRTLVALVSLLALQNGCAVWNGEEPGCIHMRSKRRSAT